MSIAHSIAPADLCGIVAFPGYLASLDGHIWSTLGQGRRPKSGRRAPFVMKTYIANGYPAVDLRRDGLTFKRRVHLLILETFSGPRPPGMICRHLDGDRLNSRLDNLAWGSFRENLDDAARHGRRKLNSAVARQIRELRAAGFTSREIAGEFGISREHVKRITNRHHYADVT